MTLATLPRQSWLGPSPGLADHGVWTGKVGPGWEVLLMPEPLARLVTDAISGSAAQSALGWIFVYAGHAGVFLPERSDDPAWPPGTTYLQTGALLTLPPFTRRAAGFDGTSGWVRQNGDPLSRPLLLHPVVTLLATDSACSPPPAPET